MGGLSGTLKLLLGEEAQFVIIPDDVAVLDGKITE